MYIIQHNSEMQRIDNDERTQHPAMKMASISGSQSPLVARPSPRLSQGAKNKTVQELIREDVGRRPPPSLRADGEPLLVSGQQASGTLRPEFLKPAVDAPRAVSSNRPTAPNDAVNSAPPGRKRNREEVGDAEGKKRKKKKDKTLGVRMID